MLNEAELHQPKIEQVNITGGRLIREAKVRLLIYVVVVELLKMKYDLIYVMSEFG